MAYDSPRVTPPNLWRYDCTIVLRDDDPALPGFDNEHSLDMVEVPGGLHAKIDVDGTLADLRRAIVGVFTYWLPRHRHYRTEGDPVVHWLHAVPAVDRFPATAIIRIYERDGAPTLNLRPLTPFERAAGKRTLPTND